ncbi:MAG TPA: phosphoribosyl-AMP cyclohydrolase [Lachnospiraceae bacterium]|jgi:Phosphoribosyl-AMP cyclohydrolase|nr:phosphoribosyl-AMP cyclohydrolase [Lachnospiraceae bacterium]
MNFIEELKFDEKGLIPVITQDYENGQVLMLAYANREAVMLTLEKGTVHYYSRSRQELWHKGDTSGHFQTVKEIFYDCDGDALLIKVEQKGAACHTGKRSCFYRNSRGEVIL